MQLKRLFTSETRVRLLSLFLLSPKTEYHVRDIARRTRLNLNSVRRELNNLEDVGVLKSSLKGNLKLYTTNENSPINDELKRILLKTESVGNRLRSVLPNLGRVEMAFIYGSFAEGDEKATSDIDVFIVGEIDQDKAATLFEGMQKDLSREINYAVFSPQEFKERRARGDPFVTNVMKQKKIKLV